MKSGARRKAAFGLSLGLSLAGMSPSLWAVNSELDVKPGSSNLLVSATYMQATPPATTSDVTFTATVYAPVGFTVNGANTLSIGTLNDFGTPTLTISNTTASTAATLILNGGGDMVSGTPADLFYVNTGSTLLISSTAGNTNTLGLTLAAAGNLDIAGASTISAIITMGANAITKTGVGTLTLTGINSGTGGFTVANGTVSVGTTNGNSQLGSTGNTVTLGSGATNSTLNFSAGQSGLVQNVVVAGSGTETISSSSASSVVFAAAQTLTLNNTLHVTGSSAAGTIGFQDTISGGNAIIVDGTNVSTVNFRGANTFGGGLTINSGTVSFQTASSVGAVGALTSGPLGTNTVTLGSGAAAATLASAANSTVGNAITVAGGGGARTISETSATTAGGILSGPITLNNDLTLTAVATTATPGGVDRLQVGSGGITGANNIIINNANAATGAVAGSGAIRLDGGATPTAWTGSLIVAAGQGSLGTNTATGAGNAVDVASGATFNFSGNGALSPTIAGLNNATSAGVVGGATGGTVTNSNGGRALTLGGSGAYTFAGAIVDSTAGTSALTVNLGTASASQTLTGASTYTGPTIIANGNLRITNATGSATGTSAISLGSATLGTPLNATISGSGTSTGLLTVNMGARVAPGVNTVDADGSGRTNFGNAGVVTLGSTDGLTLTNASLDLDLSNSAASGNDLISTGGTLTLTTAGITINELNGSLATGVAYTLISGATSVAGDTTNIATTFLNGATYTPAYTLGGGSLTVMFATPAPEPGTWTMFAGGVGLLALWQRRRSRAV